MDNVKLIKPTILYTLNRMNFLKNKKELFLLSMYIVKKRNDNITSII